MRELGILLIPGGFARLDIECVSSSLIDFAVNSNVVPAFNSGPGIIFDSNPVLPIESNSNSTLSFDPGPVINVFPFSINHARRNQTEGLPVALKNFKRLPPSPPGASTSGINQRKAKACAGRKTARASHKTTKILCVIIAMNTIHQKYRMIKCTSYGAINQVFIGPPSEATLPQSFLFQIENLGLQASPVQLRIANERHHRL
ncbi:hypothetical protein EVAR_91466_1 [Eumeta japonica]|uniref:Uncharacterized protein n=1 Tax=Eumeta variegata TaxID=151549 RepID=A0A4C1X394_EUMVA|nr:hypothetical protein EVAR_91466_1 [Eumeta japonica]